MIKNSEDLEGTPFSIFSLTIDDDDDDTRFIGYLQGKH